MHHTPRAPYRLAAPLLALTAALAGCGGGSSDTPPAPPGPAPTQFSVTFTSPALEQNVYDVHTPIALQVRVDVNNTAAANNTPVAFSAAASTMTPATASTVGGFATSTLNGSVAGPLQVQATATVSGYSASASRTLYLRPPRQPLEVLVPAYFNAGSNSPWEQLISGARSHPDVPITAILNPTNGIFTDTDTEFVNAIKAFKATSTSGNRQVIGYVSTDYGNNSRRSRADILANVNNYLAKYPLTDGVTLIDGIFLDEMAATNDRLPFYRDIYDDIKAVNPRLRVIGNPGTFPIAAYSAVADALVTFEGQAVAYQSIDPQPFNTWVYNKANAAQVMLVHDANCTAMQSALQRADLARTNTGLVYATNLHFNFSTGTGNPWADLPVYWTNLLGTVSALNSNRTLPNC